MRIGLIARSEDRGIGQQTWRFFQNMPVAATLLVELPHQPWRQHPERYPGAHHVVAGLGSDLDRDTVERFLSEVDVVFAVETMYDWRIVDWANARGVATVVQLNPEFFKHTASTDPHPTRWWAPTPWLLDRLPEDTELVPVPCEPAAPAPAPPPDDGVLRVLHVVGHQAHGDRNGTLLTMAGLRLVRREVTFTITTQDRRLPSPSGWPRNVNRRTIIGSVPDHDELFREQDVLLLPRRYGGLCLPALEAMARGVAVAMTDCSPNRMWPIVPIPAREDGEITVPGLSTDPRVGGRVPLHGCSAAAVSSTITDLALNPTALANAKANALAWAEGNSWDKLRPLYLAKLAEAVEAIR